jgi:hypothetical protein
MIARVSILACVAVALSQAVACGATPTSESKAPASAKKEPRSLTAIQTDIRAALTAEAKSRRKGDNAPDVLRLVDLYLEMATHPERDKSAMLNELGQQVRARLVTIRDRSNRQIADAKRAEKIRKAPATVATPVATPKDDRVLAQQLPAQNAGNARQGVGQGMVVNGIQRPSGLPADMGPDLVALIEATISPATWNINGGPGAIVYYTPLHVLVVAAPQNVHEEIAGVIRQLNLAQRKLDGTQVVAGVNAVQNNDAQVQNP